MNETQRALLEKLGWGQTSGLMGPSLLLSKLTTEITEIYSNKDSDRIRDLHRAYIKWCRYSGPYLPEEELIRDATGYLDYICQMADSGLLKNVQPDGGVLRLGVEGVEDEEIGPIRRFYRESIGKNET